MKSLSHLVLLAALAPPVYSIRGDPCRSASEGLLNRAEADLERTSWLDLKESDPGRDDMFGDGDK